MEARWALVVPVKDTAIGKSRLAALGADRPALAAAMALDTIAAVEAASRVREIVVVTSDPGLRRELVSFERALVVADPGTGLRGALLAGIGRTTTRYVAVITADLPGLRPRDLDDALATAERHRLAVVADAEGTGTTLLAATERTALDPRFGVASFDAHRDQGAVPLAAASSLRRDVDLPAHLRVLTSTLGPRTSALLARLAVR